MENIELLGLAVFLWVLGYVHTGRFVRPRWKIPGKFLFYTGVSALLTYWWDYYALFFIVGHPALGIFFHSLACRKHGINWLTCEPRAKYIALQEKWAKGDFMSENNKP